jgi:serine/threonine protein phosphatase PrpC
LLKERYPSDASLCYNEHIRKGYWQKEQFLGRYVQIMNGYKQNKRPLQSIKYLLSILFLLTLVLAQPVFASNSQTAAASDTPPTDQAFALARVSVVRLVVSYVDNENHVADCTGLGVLVKSVPAGTAAATTLPNDWVLTESSLVDKAKARCAEGQPAQLSEVQIFLNTSYNKNPVTVKVANPSTSPNIICSENTCNTGPAFVGFQGELAPFVDLAPTSSTDHLAIPLTSSSGTHPSPADTPGNDPQFLTPQMQDPNAAPKLEPGTPVIDAAGRLTHLAGASSLITLDGISTIINNNSLLSAPISNLVNTNWKNGIAAYYGIAPSFARPDFPQAANYFHNAATANPNNSFQGATDFENAARSKFSVNASPTATSSPSSGSGFLGINLPIQSWQLTLLLLALLVVVSLLLSRTIGARMRRRRALEDEFNDAERRAAVVAQEIEAMEASQRAWAQQRTATSEHPTVPMRQGLQDKTTVRKSTGDLRCPRCGESVVPDANYCPKCRLLLSPTESGLHLRVRPPASSAQPTVAQVPFANSHSRTIPPPPSTSAVPMGSFSDQPTLPPLPPPPSATDPVLEHSPVLGSDVTWPGLAGGQGDTTFPYSIPQVQSKRLGFMVGTRSDPGLKRKYKPNEDSLLAAQGIVSGPPGPQPFGLFVVADGMGGHANGQDASRLAIQMIVENILPRLVNNGAPVMDYAQILLEGIQGANQAVHQQNMEKRGDMGTTVTSALVVGPTAYVANVGDSRTYLYRESSGLQKITNDHSVVASLVEAGIIKPDDIYTHPKRNQIYRSLGEKANVEIDVFNVPLREGDKLLLCSDGLWDMVRDPQIEAVIRQPAPDPSKTGEDLIQSALEGGGEDNVSVIVVQIMEGKNLEALPRVELLAKPDNVQMPQL